jgi:hypothetical protein
MRREALHVAAIVAAAAVAAAVGVVVDPPAGQSSSTTAEVKVAPVDKPLMAKVHDDFGLDVPLPDGTAAGRYGRLGAVITASDSDPEEALARARFGARRFVGWLTPHQDAILEELIAEDAEGDRRARRAVLAAPVRYSIAYEPFELVADSDRSGFRGALLGLFAAIFVLAAAAVAAPRLAPGARVSPGLGAPGAGSTALLASAAAVLGAGLVAATTVLPDSAFSLFVAALLGMTSALLAWAFGRPAVRGILAVVALIVPLRGAFLGITDAAHVAEPLLAFNAIAPALIAGCALAAAGGRLGSLSRLPRPLLAGWAVIAAVCALDLLSQTVGLTVYAIGLAQYLSYPTFALLAWLVIDRDDVERAAWFLTGMGAVVGVSIFLEAADLVHFVEAANPEAALGLGAARYGGATGSYLHASMLLGTIAIVTAALLLAKWEEQRTRWLLVGAQAMIFGGLLLTYSRGGLAIFAVGALLLLVFRPGTERLRLVGASTATLAVGLLLTAATGLSPSDLVDRVGSGADIGDDPGHELRFTEMREAVDRWRAAPVAQQAFGEGLAATGNARKIASLAPDPTESYVLKLLVETGIVGMIAVGCFLLWAAVLFVRVARGSPGAVAAGLGAAGLGLTLYSLVYPTLEAQVIAFTWWLILVAVLAWREWAARAS